MPICRLCTTGYDGDYCPKCGVRKSSNSWLSTSTRFVWFTRSLLFILRFLLPPTLGSCLFRLAGLCLVAGLVGIFYFQLDPRASLAVSAGFDNVALADNVAADWQAKAEAQSRLYWISIFTMLAGLGGVLASFTIPARRSPLVADSTTEDKRKHALVSFGLGASAVTSFLVVVWLLFSDFDQLGIGILVSFVAMHCGCTVFATSRAVSTPDNLTRETEAACWVAVALKISATYIVLLILVNQLLLLSLWLLAQVPLLLATLFASRFRRERAPDRIESLSSRTTGTVLLTCSGFVVSVWLPLLWVGLVSLAPFGSALGLLAMGLITGAYGALILFGISRVIPNGVTKPVLTAGYWLLAIGQIGSLVLMALFVNSWPLVVLPSILLGSPLLVILVVVSNRFVYATSPTPPTTDALAYALRVRLLFGSSLFTSFGVGMWLISSSRYPTLLWFLVPFGLHAIVMTEGLTGAFFLDDYVSGRVRSFLKRARTTAWIGQIIAVAGSVGLYLWFDGWQRAHVACFAGQFAMMSVVLMTPTKRLLAQMESRIG